MTEETHTPPTATPRARVRRRWVRVLVITLAVLLAGAAAAAGYVAYSTKRSVSNIQRVEDALPVDSRPPAATSSAQTSTSPVNILLIGSDKRSVSENGRSDSFITSTSAQTGRMPTSSRSRATCG